MLEPPPIRSVAVSSAAWANHEARHATPLHAAALDEPGSVVVEVWTYPPECLSQGASRMIPGLDRFREQFQGLESRYLLIGGATAHLVLDEAGLAFRTTNDLDIVLCVEALDDAFVEAFWAFVVLAGYERREVGAAPRRYDRFQRPGDSAYPAMLELFSRRIDGVAVPDDMHLTPVPAGEDLSSLSAILLDDALNAWMLEGSRTSPEVQVVGAVELVALTMRAFLDLSDRRSRGETVDSTDIEKHRNDVLRRCRRVLITAPDSVPASGTRGESSPHLGRSTGPRGFGDLRIDSVRSSCSGQHRTRLQTPSR